MKSNANEAMERYPLCSLAPALKTFRPPAGAFDPNGSWRQVYGVYTLAGRRVAARRVGQVRLGRRVAGDGQVVLKVAYSKKLIGGSQEVTAELHTRTGDRLSTPRRWTFAARLLDPSGKPISRTAMERSAAFARGVVTIRDAKQTRTIPVDGACTVNWSLFDAVQRLPREPREPLAFTLIDHFDQPKAHCTLAFRGEMDVAVAGGRTIRTFSFDQLGDGNVPWVYWLDEHGRLLFIVAGLEGYLLESSASA